MRKIITNLLVTLSFVAGISLQTAWTQSDTTHTDTTFQNSLYQTFNENAWANDSIVFTTNCYTYAMRLPNAGWSIPGSLKDQRRRSGDAPNLKDENITLENVGRLLEQDGFVLISKEEALSLSPEFNVFACYVWPQEDFHFIRKDSMNVWSHKMGWDYPEIIKNQDGSYWIPTDVFLLDPDYNEFVGFYRFPKTGIEYVPYTNE